MAAERTRRLTQLMAETNALFTKDPMFGDRNASTVAQELFVGSWVVVGGRGAFDRGGRWIGWGDCPIRGGNRLDEGGSGLLAGGIRLSGGAVTRLEWAPSSVGMAESGS